jgi:hypothetical protein
MKSRLSKNYMRASRALLSLMCTGALFTANVAFATSDTWDGSTDGIWATNTNWLTDPATVPGTGDTATFSDAGNGNTTINLGSGVTISTILFDTATAAAYTIGSGSVGSQTLTFTDTGAVTMNAAVANNQIFNSNIVLGTAIAGTTTITNLTTGGTAKNITVNGTIQGGTGGTAGIKTISVSNLNGGSVTFTNAITAGGSTGINLGTFQSGNSDTIHTGTTTLSGNVTSTLRTLMATGGGSMVVDGQTVTVSTLSSYGNTGTYGKFFLNSGSVAFNGGYTTATSSGNPAGADGSALIVNGGTFSATLVTLGRSQNTGSTTTFNTTAINMGTSGFQVNGGTASVSGAVRLYGGGSSTTGQVSGTGALTIGGELSVGEVGTRTTLFQVTGGTLTNTDAVGNGIVIAKGNATNAAAGQLLLTGGTTTTEKISFGVSGGLAGSTGNLTLNGANASLYVGNGGIVKNATNSYTTAINLMNGTLGAKANWSSSLDMALAGTGVIIKAADATNTANNITLSGVLSGSNGFTKTGGGTLTLSGLNTYTGATIVNAGTLAYGNSFTMAGANQITVAATGTAGTNYATITSTAGTLTFGGTFAVNFSSSILSGGESFSLFQAAGGSLAPGFSGVSVVGSYAATLTNNSGTWTGSGNGFDFTFTAATGILAVTASAVPEPATYAALAGLGILGFAAYRRRRA